MNFAFDEEQKKLGEAVERLLADFPRLADPDPANAREKGVWDALAELGLFALLPPESQGGLGLSLVDAALPVEALGAGLAPLSVAATLAATDVISQFGTPAQQNAWLPAIASGEMRISAAISEAGAGYGLSDIKTRIGSGKLTGTKILVPDAEDASHFLVLARLDPKPALAIVAKNSNGLSIRAHEDIDPSSGLCELNFKEVALNDSAIIASEAAAQRHQDVSATIYAGLQIGIAARMLATAVDYARMRVQFGQQIGAFQAIKHRCADMAVMLEAGRSAAYYAFWAAAEDAPDRSLASSMAKAYCGEAARDSCNETIQIHGGMGFTWELGLHRHLRRAKILEHSFGGCAWHYERVLAATLAEIRSVKSKQRSAA